METMILSSSIIHSFYDQTKSSRESSENDEQLEIISAAAKLIRNDVYSMQNRKSVICPFSDIASVDENVKCMPTSLNTLLVGIVGGKRT